LGRKKGVAILIILDNQYPPFFGIINGFKTKEYSENNFPIIDIVRFEVIVL